MQSRRAVRGCPRPPGTGGAGRIHRAHGDAGVCGLLCVPDAVKGSEQIGDIEGLCDFVVGGNIHGVMKPFWKETGGCIKFLL